MIKIKRLILAIYHLRSLSDIKWRVPVSIWVDNLAVQTEVRSEGNL
jgi:hypothetical protein